MEEIRIKRMKRRTRKPSNKKPNKESLSFERLWKATDKAKVYDALIDKHSSYYFASESLQRHIK